MTAQEIAEKYVYGRHDALTDSQEIIDMKKDIEEYARACVKASLSHLLAEPCGEHCFVHISEAEDENNIILL